MSIVSQLIAAFKREAEKTPPVPNPYPGGPTGGGGPDLSTADDGHEFRQPPPDVRGTPVEELAVDGGDPAPVANLDTGSGPKVPIDRPTVGGTKAPDGPAEPTDPTPGGGGGTTTPPSAPFDPNKVIFKEVPAGGTGAGDGSRPEVRPAVKDLLTSSQGPGVEADAQLNGGGINPLVVSRDRASGLVDGGTDEPDSGDEVNDAVANQLPPVRQDDLARDTVKVLDVKADGIDAIQEPGPAGRAGIPEGHVPRSEGAAGGAGIPEGHVPRSEGAAGGAGIPEDHVPGSEGAAGGAGIPEGYDAGGESARRAALDKQNEPIDTGMDESGEKGDVARRPPTGGYIGETEKNLDLSSSAPEEGEVFSEVKFKIEPAYLKFGEAKAEIPDDADAGDEVPNLQRQVIDNSAASQISRSSAAAMTDDGPVPVPYPNADEKGDDVTEAFGKKLSIPVDADLPDDPDLASAVARKAGEGQKDFPDIKLQESPELDDDDGLTGALARKAGEGQKDFFKVKMEEVFVTSARSEGEPPDGGDGPDDETGPEAFLRINKGPGPKALADLDSSFISDNDDLSDDDKASVAGWIARGKGTKKGFNRQEMDETLESSEASAVDGDFPDDDDFASSSLLDLRAGAAPKEMLPGLAGALPDDAELDLGLDDDLDDTDESEL